MGSLLRHGFSLIEIMIVVAVIGLLAALSLPAFAKARHISLRNKCIENQRMIFMAVNRYEADCNCTLDAMKDDGVALRNTLVAAGFINIQDAFECPASSVKDYDDIHLLYKGSDFTNTTCTIFPAEHYYQ